MSPTERAIDRIAEELKAFRQNNQPDQYSRLLAELREKTEEWMKELEKHNGLAKRALKNKAPIRAVYAVLTPDAI